MQFKIRITGLKPDVDVIEQALRAVDPAALVDIDQTGQILRVAASIEPPHLLGLMGQVGYPVAQEQLEQVPSECCGGCGG
jgi:hypothetical protein